MVSSKSNSIPKEDSSTAVNGDNTNNNNLDVASNDFKEGVKVLAYHGPRVYEAKVQKVEFRKEEWKYYVHYLGWNKSWDEWVPASRLMKITPENLEKQEELNNKAPEKNFKSGRSNHKSKSSAEAKVDKEDPKNDAMEGKRRKIESVTETEDKDAISEYKPPMMKIEIPSVLKKQLVDDWEFVTQMGKLVNLPRSPCVDDIFKKYLEEKTKKDGKVSDGVTMIMNGLRNYIDKGLERLLLYTSEREQYKEEIKDNISPCTVYGAEHLLRLFVKLPELLVQAGIEEETQPQLHEKLLDFLKFLQRNQSSFFLPTYSGGSKGAEESSKEDAY